MRRVSGALTNEARTQTRDGVASAVQNVREIHRHASSQRGDERVDR
jgi:hypothetical protein